MHDRIDIDPKHSRAIVQEIGERLRAVLKAEPDSREVLERNSTASANWRSHHHQSFQRPSVGTSASVELPGQHGQLGRNGRAMPSVKRRASKIVNEYGAAQSELIGKARGWHGRSSPRLRIGCTIPISRGPFKVFQSK
jgi:hypothetical protein